MSQPETTLPAVTLDSDLARKLQTEGSGVLEGDVVDDARYLGTVPPQERDPSHNFTPCRYESDHLEVLMNVAANVVGYENATPTDLDEAWEQVGIQHVGSDGRVFAVTTFTDEPRRVTVGRWPEAD